MYSFILKYCRAQIGFCILLGFHGCQCPDKMGYSHINYAEARCSHALVCAQSQCMYSSFFVLDESDRNGFICILDCGFIPCTRNIKENWGTQEICSFMWKNKSNSQNRNETLVLLETMAVFLLIPVWQDFNHNHKWVHKMFSQRNTLSSPFFQ